MKINQLTYYDKKIDWRLSSMHLGDLNLLVGISGVGKTQILKSIMNLREIAKGRSLNGVTWNVTFSINSNVYQWKGEFEYNINNLNNLFSLDINDKSDNFKIVSEYLYVNNEIIIEKNHAHFLFKGNTLPKLSPFISAINILSEEDDIYPVKEGFNKLLYSEQSRNNYHSFDEIAYLSASIINYDNLANEYSSIEAIQESNLPIQLKLGLCYEYNFSIFQKIKEQFIDIFEHVEDIKVETDKDKDFPKFISAYPFVKIKEKGINGWIKQNQISSGMLKTLMHISELYLSADGTVILIDEFENSLGINCIDILSDLLIENRNLQFIITSHHPYIINKIGMEHWKIITRKGSVVTARDMKELSVPKSRHQAFMQLINLHEYREGIAAG